MKRIFFSIGLIISLSSCDSKTESAMGTEVEKDVEPVFEIQKIASLEDGLEESSGVLFLDGTIYTHSDIGGPAMLLQLNLDGTINKTISFQNINVKDWEDIAADENFLYIADIGNNLANRKDLRIFKVKRSEIDNTNATAETIGFSFEDQTDFGNGEYNQTSYDVEAIAVKGDDVYIFTKDWLKLNTNVYKVGKNAGNFPLQPVATLNIGGMVTGATTAPDGNIVVCGYSPTLSPFVAQISFENGTPTVQRKVDITGMLGSGSQIEGVTYAGKVDGIYTYYLTSEHFTRTVAGQNIEFPANLYEMKWNE